MAQRLEIALKPSLPDPAGRGLVAKAGTTWASASRTPG